MENFFYEDTFCSDMEDLCYALDLDDTDGDDIKALPDDWSIEVFESSKEKIFTVTAEDVREALHAWAERYHDERFPEDDENIDREISKAFRESVDVEKLNAALPSVYYPTKGKATTITKQDLLQLLD